MKPNFILELSQTGICLRQLTGGKTRIVGEVSLSDSEFDSKVAALRNEVAEKSDAPMASELRIPNSEILFTTIDDPEYDAKTTKGSQEALREKAVRDALEGMTPYALPDLNFVWKVKGKGELSIAAVARETLAEAEEFAVSRGFNPVSFAARPGKAKFQGTAQFGPTELQRKRAAAEEREAAEAKAQAEREARRKADEAARAKAAQEAEAKAQEAARAAETKEPPKAKAAEDQKKPAVDSAKPATAEAPAQTPAAKKPGPDSAPPAKPAPPAAQKDAAPKGKADGAPATAPPAEGAQRRLNLDKATPPAKPGAADAKPQPAAEPAAEKPAPKDAKAETPRVGFSGPRINDPLPPLDDDGIIDDVPAMPVAFATRRKQQAELQKKAPGKPAPGPLTPGAAAEPDPKESRFGRIAARFAVTPDDSNGAVPPPPPRRGPGAGKPGANTVLRGSAKNGAAKPAVGLPDSSEAAATLTPTTDANGQMLTGRDRDAVSARMASGRKLDEAEAMTVFGARAASESRSFRPLLIAIAIALVLAIAVWAAFLLMGNDRISDQGEAALPENSNAVLAPAPLESEGETDTAALAPAETAPEAEPAAETPAAPSPSADTEVSDLAGESGAAEQGNANAGQPSAPDSTVAILGPQPPVAPAPEGLPISPTAPDPISEDPLQRPPAQGGDENIVGRYATTGIWIESPNPPDAPGTDRVDDLYVASADPTITLDEADTLVRPGDTTSPTPLAPQLPPAPQGDGFELDDRGLVTATPDGTLSPDGILITAGPPPRTPPTTPERPETLAPDPATQPDLPRIRPRTRPDDATASDDQTNLDNAAAQAVQEAGVQPRPRPDTEEPPRVAALDDTPTAQDDAEAAAVTVAGASTATPEAPVATQPPRAPPADLIALRAAQPEPEEEAEPEEPVSPFAVARSRLPKTKPGNFAQQVASARAKAAAAPQQQVVTRVAAPAAVTTPSIPSRASVAKQATVKNAINLGKVNLIGVYGSSSNRRALVRLPSGKFVKVKVGDRVDGGQVAAIGQSDLSYTKSGRRVTLSMPNG
ncbi:hypothetical protein [Oceaniglobus trochenteri]|uniref:hypothetical protein n=1 Tax=Oceaniglobus trochenteri TaxID=2763260 RepID=UPI001CFF9992|nr:hypothetical protein [Oceaniglobus trochenteri]